MTPDEPSAAPRKRSWKRWIVVLACVVAGTIIALLANAPKNPPVAVWFAQSTNLSGHKWLVFQGTNGTTRGIRYHAHLVTDSIRPPKTMGHLRSFSSQAAGAARAGESFSFTLEALPKEVPYHVTWFFYDQMPPATRWERFRTGCFDFFRAHGMYGLARRFMPTPKEHFIPSTEFKE